MKWLTDYAWVDDEGTLHLEVERVLIAKGIPVTRENVDDAAKLLYQEVLDQLPNATVEVEP